MNTLRQIHAIALLVAEALANKDIIRFGRLIDQAWILNKQLDPNSSNQQIEELLQKVKPHIFGAKLLGAGGGGFLFMVCKSPPDATKIRKLLTKQPPNDHARFFDYHINHDGLLVTLTDASKSPFHN
jgi:galactokinase/mevalonate kinase-like predicted kinase